MKLRELINRLEELSHNGRNDNLDVEIFVDEYNYIVDGNEIGDAVTGAYISRFVSPNDEYDFIQIRADIV